MEKKPDNLNPDIEFKSYKIISELLEEEREKKRSKWKVIWNRLLFPFDWKFQKIIWSANSQRINYIRFW